MQLFYFIRNVLDRIDYSVEFRFKLVVFELMVQYEIFQTSFGLSLETYAQRIQARRDKSLQKVVHCYVRVSTHQYVLWNFEVALW